MLTRLRRLTALRDESAQMAIAFMLVMVGVVALFGLSFDTGTWYLNHRNAQNEVDAAALAAVQQLPASDTSAAAAAARATLTDNGADLNDLTCLAFSKTYSSKYDTVKVCVRRSSQSYFSSLAHIDFATVSASAVATAGPAESANVLPLSVVQPDPTCGPDAGRNCLFDANGDGDYNDPGDCDAPFSVCPWGLMPNHLYVFKSGGGGDTGPNRVCGNGASDYVACLSGSELSDPVGPGSTIEVKPGNLGSNTNSALGSRDPGFPDAWQGSACDVQAFPSAPGATNANDPGGYDPVGSAAAMQAYVTSPTDPDCRYRVVVIPILNAYPDHGNAAETVLGLGTFVIVSWNRANGSSKDTYGNPGQACNTGASQTGNYNCGAVWGYFMPGATAPDFDTNRFTDSGNSVAPILRALTN